MRSVLSVANSSVVLCFNQLRRGFAAPLRPIEVTIEADDREVITFRDRILMSIIEIEAELLCRSDNAVHLPG